MHLILCVVVLGLQIWIEQLRHGDDGITTAASPGELLTVAAFMGSLMFEISALIWLRRHARRLARLFAEARPGSREAKSEGPKPTTSGKAAFGIPLEGRGRNE